MVRIGGGTGNLTGSMPPSANFRGMRKLGDTRMGQVMGHGNSVNLIICLDGAMVFVILGSCNC
jgi:hypothetical protein